jgi:hypothetical protein
MIKLSNKQINYSLFGLLLGDGYLDKWNWININHTNKQRWYISWLEQLMIEWKVTYKTQYDYKVTTNYGDFVYSRIAIKVPNSRHFCKFNRTYNEMGKKYPSDYMLYRITELGLLFWFLDDGCLSVKKRDRNSYSRFATLNTQGYSLEDNKKIQKVFLERFSIITAIHKDRHYFKIYMNATNFRLFYDLVKKYFNVLPKEAEYKFNMKYELNKMSNSGYLAENYNFIKD